MSTTSHRSNSGQADGGLGSAVRRWWWAPVGAAVIALAGGIIWLSGQEAEAKLAAQTPLFPVKQGPLTISVTSSGSIRSGDARVIKNEVEGRTTVLWLIEEGAEVQAGDRLIELDSSELEDRRVDQEIRVETASANLTTAKLNSQIVEKQGQADIQTARVNLDLAKLDLEKYIGQSEQIEQLNKELEGVDLTSIQAEQTVEKFQYILDRFEGEYQQELQTALNKIRLAQAELERANDKLDGSQKLFELGYITDTELEADKLDQQRRASELQLAIGEMRLMLRFTYQRRIAELQSAVDQAEFALEKARHEAEANLTDARAKLKAEQLTYDREKDKLDKIDRQLAACEVTAPVAGMVIYGTSGEESRYGRQEPLDEGVEVRQRQDLFRIVTGGALVADVKIHESMVDKVRPGLPVILTTDALPGREFRGHIRHVSPVPDAQNAWLNPDLKVYNTEIALESDATDIRPGMSCNAEILVERYDETLYVPVQSVQRVGGRPTVHLMTGGGPEPRPVEIGLDNNRFVRIVSGLKLGDPVMLNPPPQPAARSNDLDFGEATVEADAAGPAEANPAAPAGDGPQPAAADQRTDWRRQSGGPGGPGGAGPGGQAGGNDWRNMSDEQRQQMRQRFENMSEEERQQMRQRFESQQGGRGSGDVDWQNMSDEQRQQMRERFRSQRGGEGRGDAARPDQSR